MFPNEIATLVTTAGSVAAAVIAYLVKRQVTTLHVTINSRMDTLLELTAKAAAAAAVLAERQRVEEATRKEIPP